MSDIERQHPAGCSCDACDCMCVEHCPVHPRVTHDELMALRAVSPELAAWRALSFTERENFEDVIIAINPSRMPQSKIALALLRSLAPQGDGGER